LFTRWGVRKHLLDDLYIRFFRLAEERIGQAAEHGVVSFISNSSYLAGRSHPIMIGTLIAILLDPLQEPRSAIRAALGNYAPRLAALTSIEGGAVRENDLVITIAHFGGARGGWRPRPYGETEEPPDYLGEMTGDLHINEQIFFRNIPSDVWSMNLAVTQY
jgi:hypothetical protein